MQPLFRFFLICRKFVWRTRLLTSCRVIHRSRLIRGVCRRQSLTRRDSSRALLLNKQRMHCVRAAGATSREINTLRLAALDFSHHLIAFSRDWDNSWEGKRCHVCISTHSRSLRPSSWKSDASISEDRNRKTQRIRRIYHAIVKKSGKRCWKSIFMTANCHGSFIQIDRRHGSRSVRISEDLQSLQTFPNCFLTRKEHNKMSQSNRFFFTSKCGFMVKLWLNHEKCSSILA